MRNVFQYQGKTEPLEPIVAAETVTIDKWFVLAAGPVPEPPPPITGGGTFVIDPTLHVAQALDWIVQHPEPVIAPHQTRTGMFSFHSEPIVSAARVVTVGGVTISSVDVVLTG